MLARVNLAQDMFLVLVFFGKFFFLRKKGLLYLNLVNITGKECVLLSYLHCDKFSEVSIEC